MVVFLRIRFTTGCYRLVDLERLKRSTRREEEEARVSQEENYLLGFFHVPHLGFVMKYKDPNKQYKSAELSNEQIK